MDKYTPESMNALLVALGRFPRISEELGERLLDCPEGVIEDVDDGMLPSGFINKEQFDDFVSLYTQARWMLTNGVAEVIGVDAAGAILDRLHVNDPRDDS